MESDPITLRLLRLLVAATQSGLAQTPGFDQLKYLANQEIICIG